MMPIDTSLMVSAVPQPDGRIYYTEVHTDHLGRDYRFSYRVAPGIDAQAVMASRAVKLIGKLEDNERRIIARAIEAGTDPATITPEYLTNAQALTVVLKTAMRLPAAEAMVVAEFINSTLSNAQLDNMFSVAIRQRIRIRVASVLALKSGLDADRALEEDL